MRKLSILGAAAILASAAALPSMAQAACAQYDPGCDVYPMPKQSNNTTKGNPGNARAEVKGTESRSYQIHHHHRSTAPVDRMEQH
jgi:hypothetical protein